MARKINAENRRGEAPVHNRNPRALVRSLGLVIVTGAADDDCSAIGTYASAGAQLGTLVTGKDLFHIIRVMGWSGSLHAKPKEEKSSTH